MTLLDLYPGDVRTARLVLRPLRLDDAACIFTRFGSWEIIRALRSPPWPYRAADAEDFCRERARQTEGGPLTYAITRNGALVGVIDAVSNPIVQRGPGYTLGYWIGQPWWGGGYMSEAARGFIAHVLATTGTETIYSGVFKENEASLRVQDKLGFVRREEEMLYSKPRRMALPFINTRLTRARFRKT